jgi:hypothetical protein
MYEPLAEYIELVTLQKLSFPTTPGLQQAKYFNGITIKNIFIISLFSYKINIIFSHYITLSLNQFNQK